MQISSLYYLNNYFLADKSTFMSEKVYSETKEMPKNIAFKVPKNTSNIQPSYDGSYIAYMKNHNLIIYKSSTSKDNKPYGLSIDNVDYYKWLPDRNRLLYTQIEHRRLSDKITINAYDLDSNKKQTVNSITYLPRNSSVSDIEISPLTNMIYIKVSGGDGYDRLYQINIMGTIKKIWTPVRKIIKMRETQETDNLVYQSSNNIIHVIRDGKEDTYLSYNKYALIGIDSKDRVYLGRLNGTEITKIYYGYLDKPLKLWNTITLPKPLNPDNVVIGNGDNLYSIQNGKELKGIKEDTVVSGPGSIMYLDNKLIAFRNADTVVIKKIQRYN